MSPNNCHLAKDGGKGISSKNEVQLDFNRNNSLLTIVIDKKVSNYAPVSKITDGPLKTI